MDDLLEPKAPLEAMYAGFEAIAAAPVPTVAAVGGAAVGAGVNVALACDVIVCSPSARFDPRWLDVGIHPGGGNLWLLRERVGRQAAAALVLCGESVDGDEAARMGWRGDAFPTTTCSTTAVLAGVASRRGRDRGRHSHEGDTRRERRSHDPRRRGGARARPPALVDGSVGVHRSAGADPRATRSVTISRTR